MVKPTDPRGEHGEPTPLHPCQTLDPPGLETEFEAYERKVSRIMVRYGGVIERVIRTSGASDDPLGRPFEVHVLSFPIGSSMTRTGMMRSVVPSGVNAMASYERRYYRGHAGTDLWLLESNLENSQMIDLTRVL